MGYRVSTSKKVPHSLPSWKSSKVKEFGGVELVVQNESAAEAAAATKGLLDGLALGSSRRTNGLVLHYQVGVAVLIITKYHDIRPIAAGS